MEQILGHLERILAAATKQEAPLNPGATEDEISMVEAALSKKFPDDLRQLYRYANGQNAASGLFEGYWLNSLKYLTRDWTLQMEMIDDPSYSDLRGQPSGPCKAYWFHEKWIPVFGSDNKQLVVDLDPEPDGAIGQVVEVFFDDERRSVVAPNLNAYFVGFVSRIEAGDLRYHPDAGGFYQESYFEPDKRPWWRVWG